MPENKFIDVTLYSDGAPVHILESGDEFEIHTLSNTDEEICSVINKLIVKNAQVYYNEGFGTIDIHIHANLIDTTSITIENKKGT